MRAHSIIRAAAVGMAALALLAGGMESAKAQTITLNAVNSGWYNSTGSHSSTDHSYIAGRASTGNVYRNFFVFNLSGITLPIASAELRLFNPEDGYASSNPFESFTLFDIYTSIPTLVAGGAGLTSVFDDLGSGVTYGAQAVSAADNGRIVTIGFNADGLAALNSASGLFAIGGSLETLGTGVPERVFGFTLGTEPRQLVVTLVPEPGTVPLIGTGIFVLLSCGRQRRRQEFRIKG